MVRCGAASAEIAADAERQFVIEVVAEHQISDGLILFRRLCVEVETPSCTNGRLIFQHLKAIMNRSSLRRSLRFVNLATAIGAFTFYPRISGVTYSWSNPIEKIFARAMVTVQWFDVGALCVMSFCLTTAIYYFVDAFFDTSAPAEDDRRNGGESSYDTRIVLNYNRTERLIKMRVLLTLFGCLILTGCSDDQSTPVKNESQAPESTTEQEQILEARHACVIFHKHPDGLIQTMTLVDEGQCCDWGGEKKMRRKGPDEEWELSFEFTLLKHKDGKDVYAVDCEWSVMRKVEGAEIEGGAQVTGGGEGWGHRAFVEYDGNPVRFGSDETGETWLMSRQAAAEQRKLAQESQGSTAEESVQD